jgi:hypothetical protein
MEQRYEKEIEEIIGQTACPKDFACHKSAFDVLCKAKDVGLASYVMCLENSANGCKFSVSYGDSYYCRCPVRVYVAKNFGK